MKMSRADEGHSGEQRVRRNSLGFIIQHEVAARKHQASIMWGKRQDGSRVFITDAGRGSKQGLLCECGSVLVAKQGAIYAWHFAHKADDRSYCRAAAEEALAAFAARVVRTTGIIVPASNDYMWCPEEVECELMTGGVILRTRRASAKLDIFVCRRRWPSPSDAAAQRQLGVSALAIVLGEAIHLEDPAIEFGLYRGCSRSWIFNRHRPLLQQASDVLSSNPPPAMDVAARLEQMFPAEVERRRLDSKRWRGER